MSDQDEVRPKNQLAREINRLKEATVKAARDRERLPQPLFWSLFHARLSDLRKEKELKRVVQDLFGG